MIRTEDRVRAEGFAATFEAAGANRVAAPILLDAGPLLDLYGEDIRARAFTTTDPLRGEAMLRPDFTVPVAQAHMIGGPSPARYAYAGEVFRRQERDETRPREYLQAGIEILGGTAPAEDEAEVFILLRDVLAPWGPQPACGDLGLLISAVDALDTTERRRAALRRHIPRPRRFRHLLERFRAPQSARASEPPAEGPLVGKRSAAEVAARHAALAEDAAAPPIPAAQADALDALLDLSSPLHAAAARLREIETDLPGIGAAINRLEARTEALAARDIDPDALSFATTAGRGAMEYYDGFTFTFTLGTETVATGGRYDGLTAALGGGTGIPAVGGVIRPDLLGEA